MTGISHDSVNRFLHRENYQPKDMFDEAAKSLCLVGGTLSVEDLSFGVWPMDVYRSIFKEHRKEDFYLRKIMDHEGQPAGFFHCNYHQARKGVCWISMFSISPEFQAKQLGRHTFESIEQQVRANPQLQEIWLEVYSRNQAALKFWVKQGFDRIVKVMDETVEGETLSSMILSKSVAQ